MADYAVGCGEGAGVKLPTKPTLEDMTKDQLIYLIRHEMFMSIPNTKLLAATIWRTESESLKKRQNKNLAEGNRLTRECQSAVGTHLTKARKAYMANLAEFDKLQAEWDALNKYFDTVVCPKEKAKE